MWRGYLQDVRPDRYMRGTVAQGATTVEHFVGPCPEGFCWYVERETLNSSTTQTAPKFELYVLPGNRPPNDNSKANREDLAVGADVQDGVNDLASPIYVGPGMFIVGFWSGLAAGDTVAWSSQIRVHQLAAAVAHGTSPASWVADEFPSDLNDGEYIVTPDQVAAV